MNGLSIRNAGEMFNISSPGNDTDILASNITPKYGGHFQVTVALSTGSVFNVKVTDGTDTHVISLNSATALAANEMYTLTFACHPDLQYNFQVATTGVIEYLVVAEVTSGSVGGSAQTG